MNGSTAVTAPHTGGRVVANAAALGCLAVNKSMVKIGLRQQPDGWRRTCSVGLRTEATKFVLSSFGLDLWSNRDASSRPMAPDATTAQEHLFDRLAPLIETEPTAHAEMRTTAVLTTALPTVQADTLFARFLPDGSLGTVELHLDATCHLDGPISDADREAIHATFVRIWNGYRDSDDFSRQRSMVRLLVEGAFNAPTSEYSRRIVMATLVSFEPVPAGPWGRFTPPDFRHRRHPGGGPLNIVCRLADENRSVDLWVQAHHAAVDGAQTQELLTRLERGWGVVTKPHFPPPGTTLPAVPCFSAGTSPELYVVQTFIDFAPLLQVRKELNATLKARLGADITLACLLTWCLAHQPGMNRLKIASTVDVPGDLTHGRCVGLVSIRPNDYFDPSHEAGGFVAFAHEYLSQLEAARARRGTVHNAMAAVALLPPALAARSLQMNQDRVGDLFGSLGLTVLKDAHIFVAPMTDIGFDDGFIAIGGMNLPTENGPAVGCVTIKGTKERILNYPQAIAAAVAAGRNGAEGICGSVRKQ